MRGVFKNEDIGESGYRTPASPTTSETPPATRTSRKAAPQEQMAGRISTAAIALFGVIGLVVVGAVYAISSYARVYWDFGSAANEMPSALSRARELKMPLVAADLVQPVADSENAAPQLRALNAELQRNKAGGQITEAQKALQNGDVELARQAIAPLSEAYELAEAAARKPHVDYGRDWDLGPSLLFPEFASEKTAVKLMCVRSEIRGRTGDTAGALADLHAAGVLCKHAGSEPTIISMLVGIASEAIRNSTIEHLAAAWSGDPAKLSKLEEAARERQWQADWGFAMRGEEYMGVSMFRNLDAYGGLKGLVAMNGGSDSQAVQKVDPRRLIRSGEPKSVTAAGSFVRHLQLWESVWPELTRPGVDPIATSHALSRMTQFVERQKGLSYAADKILFPVFEQAGLAIVRVDAHTRATTSLIKVLEYRAKNGAFPKTLAEADAEATDPFDGKPLRYKLTKDGARVYSVGPNKIDDGGMSTAEINSSSQEFDGNRGDEVAAYPPIKTKL